MFSFLRRTKLDDRRARALEKTLQQIRAHRRSRFRVLACIDGSEEAFNAVRFAARLAPTDDCDIIVLYVRPADHGLQSGGLQVKLARQNMLEAGIDLPGIRDLARALDILKEEGIDAASWPVNVAHVQGWDAAGDNKAEYRSPEGRSVVLKLKTSPDIASGILDQYELGPYNLMILGEPSRWRGEFRTFFGTTGIVQQVAVLAPCSVLVARASLGKTGFFICTDGTARSMQTVRRAAVLAQAAGEPITLFSVATTEAGRAAAEENVANGRALLKALGIRVAEVRTAVGDPARQIIETGSAYKVIVVSDEGRSTLQRLFKGSVAYEVVRGARSSVLDVR